MINALNHPPETQLAQKARELVNQVFWGAMLRDFRQNRPPTIFDGGPGSSTFIRQLDMELLKRISQKGDSPLAQALIQKLDHQGIRKGLNLAQAQPSYGEIKPRTGIKNQ